MKKGMSTWLIVGGAVVLVGALGFILLRKPKEEQSSGNTGVANPPSPSGTGGVVVDNTAPSAASNYEVMGFVQKKNTPNVSVLKDSTLFSGVAKKLESFTSVYARPSTKSGWWEVSEDGTTLLGYVPNGTLRKL